MEPVPGIELDFIVSVLDEVDKLFDGVIYGPECEFVHSYKRTAWIKSDQPRVPSIFLNLVHCKEARKSLLDTLGGIEEQFSMVQIAYEQLKAKRHMQPLAKCDTSVFYSVPDAETVYSVVSVTASDSTMCIMLFQYWLGNWSLWEISSTSSIESFKPEEVSQLGWRRDMASAWALAQQSRPAGGDSENEDEAMDPRDYWGDDSDNSDKDSSKSLPSSPGSGQKPTATKAESGTATFESNGTDVLEPRERREENRPFSHHVETLLRNTYRDARRKYGISRDEFRSVVMEKAIRVTDEHI